MKRSAKWLWVIVTMTAAAALLCLLIAFLVTKKQENRGGDYPGYTDIRDMAEAADLVVVGDVISAHKARYLDIGGGTRLVYTLAEVRVTQTVRGDVQPGDTVTIKELGNYFFPGGKTFLAKGDQVLLFLASYDNTPCSPLNPTQAVMRIKDGKTTLNILPFLLDSDSPDVSLTDVLAVLGTPKSDGE